MRPSILNPLFAELAELKGIGPRLNEHFERLSGKRNIDLLWHFPTAVVDRSWQPKISGLEAGRIATLKVTIDKHVKSPRKGLPYRVFCSDQTGKMALVFFHAQEKYLKGQLPVGEERLVSGKVEVYQKTFQMIHPDYIVKPEEADQLPTNEAIYPLTYGLTQRVVLKTVREVLKAIPDLPEWQDGPLLSRHMWPSWEQALFEAHTPVTPVDVDLGSPARRRLAYDELLANQLTLNLVRLANLKSKGRAIKPALEQRDKVLKTLDYSLTKDQWKVLSEIDRDMASGAAMLRLMQGDVGSGKTIVAFLAMVNACAAGAQAALLAPTEILCRQHYATLKDLAAAAGLTIGILTGRDKGKARAEKLEKLHSGETQILVGTHALFQEDVGYHDLGLVVVDEQHRFGVFQRLALARKGKTHPDMLVMTATPIPRTLALTVYGDMDVSRIEEKPPGRKPVTTRVIQGDKLGEVKRALALALQKGERAYWVCPLVEEGEVLKLTAAEMRYQHLKKDFGDRVGLVHGRMKGPEKDAVMEAFIKGDIQILVATTVIEVGIDVRQATIMIIENAERFGLAQLHQLRGRVGRGVRPSYCLLLAARKLSRTARRRLSIMRESEDGFLIAEEDLRLRGAGEFLGVRQSGLPEFRVADLEAHGDLLQIARDDARLILEKDPKLETPRGQSLRTLLYLFERDAAVNYLRSG
ncbi:MAG: ATP-dependent DNA helicase RecG [Proteobacteria bacterium]|nr:ATP-dependent DNA helicase RecG [Pseudomonadota bacterium]